MQPRGAICEPSLAGRNLEIDPSRALRGSVPLPQPQGGIGQWARASGPGRPARNNARRRLVPHTRRNDGAWLHSMQMWLAKPAKEALRTLATRDCQARNELDGCGDEIWGPWNWNWLPVGNRHKESRKELAMGPDFQSYSALCKGPRSYCTELDIMRSGVRYR